MPQSLFKELLSTLKPHSLSLAKGDKLFAQGDTVVNIYQITTGKIKLVRNTIDGSPILLHIGHDSETIAEASLFSDQYHCSAIADLPSEISFLKKQELLQFLEENPKTMKKLLSVFARQVRDLRAINEIKNIRSAQQRILTFIRSHVDKNKEMKLDLSLKDIAQKIGLAHETFYRNLKNLEDSGVITRTTNAIKLL